MIEKKYFLQKMFIILGVIALFYNQCSTTTYKNNSINSNNKIKQVSQTKKMARILILSYQDKTNSNYYEYLKPSLTNAAKSMMKDKFEYIEVNYNKKKKILSYNKKFIRKIAKKLNSNVVIFGHYTFNRKIKKLEIYTSLYISQDNLFLKIEKVKSKLTSQIFDSIEVVASKIVYLMYQISKNKNNIHRKKNNAYDLYSKGLNIHYTNPQKAKEFYLKSLKEDKNYWRSLIKLGSIYNTTSEYKKALKKYQIAKKQLIHLQLTSSIDMALLNIKFGIVYKNYNKFKIAIQFFNQAKKILNKKGMKNSLIYAELLGLYGQIERFFGRYKNSLQYFNQKIAIEEKLKAKKTNQYANTLVQIGMVFLSTKNYKQAIKVFRQARKIKNELNLYLTSLYSSLMTHLGTAYMHQKEWDIALEYFIIAKKINERLKLNMNIQYANLMNNIATIYVYKKKINIALKYFITDKLIEQKLKLEDTNNYADLLNNLGYLYEIKKQYKKALRQYLTATRIKNRLKLNKTESFANLQSNIAVLYYQQKLYCKAKKHMKIALTIKGKLKSSDLLKIQKYYKFFKRKCKY